MFTTDHTTNFGEKPHRGKNGKNLSQLRKKKSGNPHSFMLRIYFYAFLSTFGFKNHFYAFLSTFGFKNRRRQKSKDNSRGNTGTRDLKNP
jgi:hypothetical protein